MTNEPNDIKIEIIEVDPEPVKEKAEEIKDYALPVKEEIPKKITEKPPTTDEYSDFIFTKYHGRKRRKGTSDNHNTTHSYSSDNHFVKDVKRKKKKPWWKKLLIILGCFLGFILLLIIAAIVTFFILKSIGMSELTGGDVNMTAPIIENAGVSVDNNKNTITYQGKTYAYNSNMTSILCMGIDKGDGEGLGLVDDVVGTGGQADALYMVAFDTATGETDIIAISRDIYGDIGVYSADGNYTGTEKAQLCLAYAYGDGKEKSCVNTVDAVKRLFYNLPINSYFAMELDAIGPLNDAVGGVTVTLTDEYLYHVMRLGHAGDRVTLVGNEARAFLQYREVSELNSSVDRMNRQISYLEGFASTAIDMTKQDLSTPVNLYNIVSSNSVTNLNASRISAIGYTIATSGASCEFAKVPGEVIHNGEYAEYVVDEQGLLELILNIYYKPVN